MIFRDYVKKEEKKNENKLQLFVIVDLGRLV